MKRIWLIAATAAALLVIGVEVGSNLIVGKVTASEAQLRSMLDDNLSEDDDIDRDEMIGEMKERQKAADPPGLAIRYHAVIDIWVFLTFLTWLVANASSHAVVAKFQGIAYFLVSLALLIGCFVMLFVALGLLFTMVGMFLAAPFGTLAYLAIFGFFDRGGAKLSLSLIMSAKLAAIVFGFLATRQLLSNKGLVFLLLTSLLATILTSCLHGIVPVILVSITDAVAAIVIAVLGIIWAIFYLIGSILGLIAALKSST